MKDWGFVAVTICLVCVTVSGQTQPASGRAIALTSQMEEVVVPAGRMWKIEKAELRKDEGGVGTADIYIDGEIFMGPNKDFTLNGRFELQQERDVPYLDSRWREG